MKIAATVGFAILASASLLDDALLVLVLDQAEAGMTEMDEGGPGLLG